MDHVSKDGDTMGHHYTSHYLTGLVWFSLVYSASISRPKAAGVEP